MIPIFNVENPDQFHQGGSKGVSTVLGGRDQCGIRQIETSAGRLILADLTAIDGPRHLARTALATSRLRN